jgi:hypothetical protein
MIIVLEISKLKLTYKKMLINIIVKVISDLMYKIIIKYHNHIRIKKIHSEMSWINLIKIEGIF